MLKLLHKNIVRFGLLGMLVLVLVSLSYKINISVHADYLSFNQSGSDFAAGSGDSNIAVDGSGVRLQSGVHQEQTTTTSDFSAGTIKNLREKSVGDGALELEKINYSYNGNFNSYNLLYNQDVGQPVLDTASHLLYVPNYGGLSVVDTKNTKNGDDDTVALQYRIDTTPALTANQVGSVALDTVHHLIFAVVGADGVQVINTQGTATQSDDTISAWYHSSSSPSILDNQARYVRYDETTNYLYVGTNSYGLIIIDTKGTPTMSDDVVLGRFSDDTTVAIAGHSVVSTYLDTTTHILYIGAYFGGLSAIDTHNTATVSDDTLIKNYTNSTTPSVVGAGLSAVTGDPAKGLVWVSGSALTVLDTKGTVSPSDDTSYVYSTSSSPASLPENTGRGIMYDTGSKYIYMSTEAGLMVIDTKNTATPADDSNVVTYTTTSNPKIPSNTLRASAILDTSKELLYAPTSWGIGVFSISNEYNPTGTYTSPIISNTGKYFGKLSWGAVASSEQSVTAQTRTAVIESFTNNFDDNSASEYLGDYYGWGEPFSNAVESNGTMKISGANPYVSGGGSYCDSWFDLGRTVPVGSDIEVRLRYNSSTRVRHGTWKEYIYTDDWWDDNGGDVIPNNQWVLLTIHNTSREISRLGFEASWDGSTWDDANDSIEFDYIKVTSPTWSGWSASSTNNTVTTIPGGTTADVVQYKMTLTSSTDGLSSPYVTDVTLSSGYESTGTYISTVFDSGAHLTNWKKFTPTIASASNASVTFYTRTGNTADTTSGWTDWTQASQTVQSPASRYLQYKAVFTSATHEATYELTGMSIEYELYAPTPTSVPTSIPTATVKPTAALRSIINGSTPSIVNSPTVAPSPTESESLGNEPTMTVVPTPTASEPMGNETTPTIVKVLKIVLKDKNGKPLAFVKVTLHSTPRTATTDKDGVATFQNVEVGEHTLEYNFAGKSYSQKVAVTYKDPDATGNGSVSSVGGSKTASSQELQVIADNSGSAYAIWFFAGTPLVVLMGAVIYFTNKRRGTQAATM